MRAALFYAILIFFNAIYFLVLRAHGRGYLFFGPVVLAQLLLLTFLETRFPARPEWTARRGRGLWVDILTPLGNLGLFRPLIALVPVVGLPHVFLQIDPARFATPVRRLPFAVQCALALLALDLGVYLAHRLLHARPLWHFHKAHHEPGELFSIRGFRLHAFDDFFQSFLATVTALVVGLDHEAIAFAVRNVVILGLLSHCNVAFGLLPPLTNTPADHREHHRKDLSLPTANFCLLTTFWDRVFGTYRRATVESDAAIELGIEGSDVPQSYLGQLAQPFAFLLARVRRQAPSTESTSLAEEP